MSTALEFLVKYRACHNMLLMSVFNIVESAAARPKLKLLPRTVKDPVNTVVMSEKNASIFGKGKPREPSPRKQDCSYIMRICEVDNI